MPMIKLRPPRNKYDWIMLALGLLAFVFGARSLWWGHASTQWPRQEAVITASKVHHVSKGVNFEVRYEFDCGGRRCTGTRWHYRLFPDSPDDIWLRDRGKRTEATAASYPVGKRIEVAVKPGDPDESVLEPGMSSDDATVAGFGAVLVLLAFMATRREVAAGGVTADGARGVPPAAPR
jgi:hypothetical protein